MVWYKGRKECTRPRVHVIALQFKDKGAQCAKLHKPVRLMDYYITPEAFINDAKGLLFKVRRHRRP